MSARLRANPAGGVSAVQAVSTAAFLHALDKSSQTPPQAGRPPTDALISSLAALSLVGGDSFPGGWNQRNARGHSPFAGVRSENALEGAQMPRTPGKDLPEPLLSPYNSHSGLAKDMLPQVKSAPTLQRGSSLDSGLPIAYVVRSPSLTEGSESRRKRTPHKGAEESVEADGQERDPPEGEPHGWGAEPQWKGPGEEERLRYMGENESANKVVSWLNQVPPVDIWAEPDGHGPEPSDSPAVGRPSPRGFGGEESEERPQKSDGTFANGRRKPQGFVFSDGNGDGTANSRKRTGAGRPREASEGSNTREGVHSNGGADVRSDGHTKVLEIARTAARQELPDEEEAVQRWSSGSQSVGAQKSASSGNSGNRLSALAEADELSSDANGSRRQSGTTGYRDNPSSLGHDEEVGQYGREDATAGAPPLEEPQTPDFQPKRKGFCFPTLQKLVGKGKTERVSANTGRRLPAPQHEAVDNYSGPGAFLSARESSLDPLSQSYAFTEGGDDGFTTVRSSPASTSTRGLESGVRGRLLPPLLNAGPCVEVFK